MTQTKWPPPNPERFTNWFMIVAATIVLVAFLGSIMSGVIRSSVPFLETPHLMSTKSEDLVALLRSVTTEMFAAMVGPWAFLMVVAVLANLVQAKAVFLFEFLRPKLSRFSPATGAKKILSPNSVMELAKTLVKIAIIGGVVGFLVWPERVALTQLMAIGLLGLLREIEELILLLLVGVVAALGLIAIVDFLYQHHRHTKQLKMSKTDVKDESKQSEGDPLIKARIRSIRLERARVRMMAAVPDADVVITNPTHYAVTLKYESETMAASKVAAKGVDELAPRIRDVAEEHGVPIVENPPVAQALYAAVELDQEVPVEHYKAVAQIISYVMQLRPGRADRQRAAL